MYNIVLQEGSGVRCSRAQILELAAHCLDSVLASLSPLLSKLSFGFWHQGKLGRGNSLYVGKTFNSSRLTGTGYWQLILSHWSSNVREAQGQFVVPANFSGVWINSLIAVQSFSSWTWKSAKWMDCIVSGTIRKKELVIPIDFSLWIHYLVIHPHLH